MRSEELGVAGVVLICRDSRLIRGRERRDVDADAEARGRRRDSMMRYLYESDGWALDRCRVE